MLALHHLVIDLFAANCQTYLLLLGQYLLF